MQVITIENAEFPALKSAFADAKSIGRYWRNGSILLVRATNKFLLVADELQPDRIAVRPARSFSDAEILGKDLLSREEQRGTRVERNASQ